MISSSTDNPDTLLEREHNPYLAPERLHEPAPLPKQFYARKVFLILVGVMLLTIVGGTIAAHIDIESIIVSGAIVSLLGISIAVLAMRVRRWTGVMFGLSGPAITLFCFLLINIQEWSPGDAQVPVSRIVTVYAAVAIVLGIAAFVTPDDHSVFGDQSSADADSAHQNRPPTV
ncbi:MAG: hypothetical protein R3C19_14525 [Planctomycetaceae bacterium]